MSLTTLELLRYAIAEAADNHRDHVTLPYELAVRICGELAELEAIKEAAEAESDE